MKRLVAIDHLHRRRLASLEVSLQQARAAQAASEAVLAQRIREELATQEAGLQLRREIDAFLFMGTVKRPDISKAQHQLLVAKDALIAARKAIADAQDELKAAIRRTEEAVWAWRQQARRVEKFDTILQQAREARAGEVLYREEMELEDLFRKRA